MDKPAGVVVHPSAGHAHGTLVHGLLVARDRGRGGARAPRDRAPARPRHLGAARGRALGRGAPAAPAASCAGGSSSASTCALVRGRPLSRAGRIEAPIGRDRHDPTRHSLDTATPREAATTFEVAGAPAAAHAPAGRAGDGADAPDPRPPRRDRPAGERRPDLRRRRRPRARAAVPPRRAARVPASVLGRRGRRRLAAAGRPGDGAGHGSNGGRSRRCPGLASVRGSSPLTSLLPPSRLRVPAATLVSLLAVCLSAVCRRTASTRQARRSRCARRSASRVSSTSTRSPERRASSRGSTASSPGRPTADAVAVVLDYVRAHEAVFGLDGDDLAGPASRARRDRRLRRPPSPLGAGGRTGSAAFANDLRASVTSDGRILNVLGLAHPRPRAPGRGRRGLGRRGGRCDAPGRRPCGTDRPARLVAPRGAARATRFAGGHDARLVLVNTGRGVRLAWHVTADADSDEMYASLVDAAHRTGAREREQGARRQRARVGLLPGRALRRDADLARLHRPRLAPGLGDDAERERSRASSPTGTTTTRPTLPVEAASAATRIRTRRCRGASTTTRTRPACARRRSSASARGTAPTNGPFPMPPGWYNNRRQNAVQVFYFVSRFHDHLKGDPSIAWTTRNFEGGDKVVAHAGDGADTGVNGEFLDVHMPDELHVNNANMFTPPDGQSPRMQMYLFTSLTGNVNTDPTPGRERRRRRGRRLPRVRARALQPPRSRTPTAGARSTPSSPARWARAGATGTRWTSSSPRASPRTRPRPATSSSTATLGNNRPTIRTEGLDCPLTAATAACPGGRQHGRAGRLHARRHGPDLVRRRRGARRRRDLGADALGSPRCGRGRRRALPRHRGDAPLAAQPVLPGHAQRDPAGEPGRRAERSHRSRGDDLDGVRRARDGLLRGDRGRGRHDADPELRASARPGGRRGLARRRGHRLRHRQAGRRRQGRVRRPRLLGHDRRARAVRRRGRPRRHVRAGRGLEDRLRPRRRLERRDRRRHGEHRSTSRCGATGPPTTAAVASTPSPARTSRAFGCGPAHAIDQSTATGWSTVTAERPGRERARSR